MNRRKVLVGLAALAAPSSAWPQARKRPPVVGFVGFATAAVDGMTLMPFRQALAALGYQEGRSIVIESDGDVARCTR
jgi:putative tryptophan/tyrosine transport system substrate-binding protein